MNLEVLNNKENPLFNRQEFEVLLNHYGKPTPSRIDLIKKVAKELKSKEELTVIDKIFSQKGQSISHLRVLVYKKKEDIPEVKLAKVKKKAAKEETPAEQPAETDEPKAEESPSE